jgi:predicted RNase H-like nuclease (RuvC/YqgF family)
MLPYQTDLQKLKTNYSELEMKRARILREISELEEEMAHITSKAETIEMFLKGLQEQHENQINTLNTSHGNIVDALEKDKQLTQLFGNLKELERVMDEVSSVGIATSTATTVATGGAGNGNGNETEVLLETFVSYSEIETKCIEFLAKRVQLMREKIIYSQREVTEYQNLGMSVCSSSPLSLLLHVSHEHNTESGSRDHFKY